MAAQALAPVIGQSVVVDNKGGGNGAIAANLVKRADADGYTLLMQYSGYHVISPHLTKARSWEQATLPPWPMCCRRRRSSWCAPSCR
jgi:tripartite-type tricarboxylate transporter receptor subunit TctC